MNLLIIEDDPILCSDYQTAFQSDSSIHIVGVTNNSITAKQMILTHCPELIILDLELQSGFGSGLDVLHYLHHQSLINPFILVTTNNISNTTQKIVRQLGADFIFSKYQEDFSAESILNFLQITFNVISSDSQYSFTSIPPKNQGTDLNQQIFYELNLIGINSKHLGYQYLADAIKLYIKGNCPHIFPILASKYKKNDSTIQRAMQNAINSAWRTSDINDLLTHYKAKIRSDKGVPTILEFVSYYASKFKEFK